MARESCGQDEDLQRQSADPGQREYAPDDQRMYDEFADHDNDHVERDFLKSSGKRYRKVGAYDEKGERYADISEICDRGLYDHRKVEAGLSKEASDEDADEAGAEEFLGGEGLLSLRTNTKRL